MISGQHGTPQSPHYYLEIDSDERYSARLRKMFRHTYLRLRHSMDGPTETGGLIVTQAMRGRPERIGKQLSWVRFAYIGRHLKRFQNHVIAEMLPPTIGVETPNPKANLAESPFHISTTTRPWLNAGASHPRRAGVSAFGFGGTNATLVFRKYRG